MDDDLTLLYISSTNRLHNTPFASELCRARWSSLAYPHVFVAGRRAVCFCLTKNIRLSSRFLPTAVKALGRKKKTGRATAVLHPCLIAAQTHNHITSRYSILDLRCFSIPVNNEPELSRERLNRCQKMDFFYASRLHCNCKWAFHGYIKPLTSDKFRPIVYLRTWDVAAGNAVTRPRQRVHYYVTLYVYNESEEITSTCLGSDYLTILFPQKGRRWPHTTRWSFGVFPHPPTSQITITNYHYVKTIIEQVCEFL